MLTPIPGQAGAHQLRRRCAQDNFPVQCDVIRMRMANEDFVSLRFVGIQPEVQFRQVQVAINEFDLWNRHRET